MSKISLSPSPTGSAVYTIASPAGSTDRTLNLPDSAGTVATAESTLEQFNVTGSAPVFACRAFVNFNGTGTVAIREDGNVSSITDNGTGDYTINFATALPDANYSVSFGSCSQSITNNVASQICVFGANATGANTKTTSALRINCGSSASGAVQDQAEINVAIFR